MEYINIISQELIMMCPEWHIDLILGITIVILFIGSVVSYVLLQNKDKFPVCMLLVGVFSVMVEIILICIFNTFPREPTGRYTYEATINKDKITVSQYEEFIEKYNPTIKDGVYYWTD